MLSGYISAAGPSLLTVTVWTALVMLFRVMNIPKYTRKVRVRIISDRNKIRIDLNIVDGFFVSFLMTLFFAGLLTSEC